MVFHAARCLVSLLSARIVWSRSLPVQPRSKPDSSIQLAALSHLTVRSQSLIKEHFSSTCYVAVAVAVSVTFGKVHLTCCFSLNRRLSLLYSFRAHLKHRTEIKVKHFSATVRRLDFRSAILSLVLDEDSNSWDRRKFGESCTPKYRNTREKWYVKSANFTQATVQSTTTQAPTHVAFYRLSSVIKSV